MVWLWQRRVERPLVRERGVKRGYVGHGSEGMGVDMRVEKEVTMAKGIMKDGLSMAAFRATRWRSRR